MKWIGEIRLSILILKWVEVNKKEEREREEKRKCVEENVKWEKFFWFGKMSFIVKVFENSWIIEEEDFGVCMR